MAPATWQNGERSPSTSTVKILEKAIQYVYNLRYDNNPDDRPDFDVPPPIALDLMIVASYLGC
ncbi:Transcription elongation factor B polypeptide 1 [Diplonema papillatum]|nr:Transcription elongation factor B polypeptide 1 [Diplonema papillatum]